MCAKALPQGLLRKWSRYSCFYMPHTECTQGSPREAQVRRDEEAEVDPEKFQDPDNEYGVFAGTTYEQNNKEADQIYESVDDKVDLRQRKQRCVPPLVHMHDQQ